ncbi:MAG: RagB/SusD family nutrient uptake outer membrane protein [Paludibacter sp.]|nr:RagB/SusD family nutrient uptake outer membrane protein [Paludibacter sp.]
MDTINKILINVFLLIILVGVYSCEDTIPIEDSGRYSDEFVWNTPNLSRGVLLWAYVGQPTYYYDFGANKEFLEIATDDATTSDNNSTTKLFAAGMLSPGNNMLDSWASNYNKINGINIFLEKGFDGQLYIKDSTTNQRFYNRYKGEALALRAWWHYNLLKKYGGLINGVPMGIPVLKKVIDDKEALLLNRPTYLECVKEIIADCDSALKINDFPEDYIGNDLVTGLSWYGAANKKVVRFIKTLTYLQAASPAFNKDNNLALWDSAAVNAMNTIKAVDGIPNANALSIRDFYTVTNNTDVIWSGVQTSATSFAYELQNLPPTLQGNGFTNPSQELVDAFYDKNGYPISSSTIYNQQDPYSNRDPRLKQFILCNGMTYSGHTIETFEGGVDAPGSSQQASKTGYYLLKFLSPNAILYPERKNGKSNFVALFSKTELYLIFSEAMNELGGPNDNRYGLTAKQALSKIRKRAGFLADLYMNNISPGEKDKFRDLIQNERRVELCFEGKRFWDIRRWNKPINTNVSRVVIKNTGGVITYETPVVIEKKTFKSSYMPLPLNETIIIKGLNQNDGWSN